MANHDRPCAAALDSCSECPLENSFDEHNKGFCLLRIQLRSKSVPRLANSCKLSWCLSQAWNFVQMWMVMDV